MIATSMRVMDAHYPSGAVERRDALAHSWHTFLQAALPGQPVLPIPNIGPNVTHILQNAPVSGLILSGGEDWGAFPERDETEKFLFEYARMNNWPVLGVCRGAQVINRLLGGTSHLASSKAHAGTRHEIEFFPGPFSSEGRREVNSYHGRILMPQDVCPHLRIMAEAPDGSVEAFFEPGRKLAGIIWHPEREEMPAENDVVLMRKLFEEASP